MPVTDDEVLTGIEAVVGRSAALYGQLESLVSLEDADPKKVAELRDEIEGATADWYAIHRGAPRTWDLAKRSEWPAMVVLLSPAARAELEAFLRSYEARSDSRGSA